MFSLSELLWAVQRRILFTALYPSRPVRAGQLPSRWLRFRRKPNYIPCFCINKPFRLLPPHSQISVCTFNSNGQWRNHPSAPRSLAVKSKHTEDSQHVLYLTNTVHCTAQPISPPYSGSSTRRVCTPERRQEVALLMIKRSIQTRTHKRFQPFLNSHSILQKILIMNVNTLNLNKV